MKCRYHLRAFADCGSHALDRAGADIAHCEHAAAAGRERRPIDSHFGAGAHKALVVQRYVAVRQPRSVGVRTDDVLALDATTSLSTTNSTLGRAAIRSIR